MKKRRLHYVLLIFFTIFIGLLSRKIFFSPLWIGDMLWGIMILFIVKFIDSNMPGHIAAIHSLIICYLVEFSQLYQGEWINMIRNTRLGHLVLGQGFLWRDLFAYTIGIVSVSWILKSRKKKRAQARNHPLQISQRMKGA